LLVSSGVPVVQVVKESIYDHPAYYDLVYGSDWKTEFDFLLACQERYCQRPKPRFLEPACGTGRLIYRLAKQGHEVSGLDLNAKAIAFCNQRLNKFKLPASAFVGDMCDFTLAQPADFAFNTINSFRHLQSEQLAERHLHCMANALSDNGIYLLGFHLSPTQGEAIDEESWVARRGNLQVNTQMYLTKRDQSQRLEYFATVYDIYSPESFFQIQDTLAFRTYQAAEFQQLIDETARFDILETYDFSYEIDLPIEINEETEDVVYILRKRN
jgi:SAM-dependent methyltransferase